MFRIPVLAPLGFVLLVLLPLLLVLVFLVSGLLILLAPVLDVLVFNRLRNILVGSCPNADSTALNLTEIVGLIELPSLGSVISLFSSGS